MFGSQHEPHWGWCSTSREDLMLDWRVLRSQLGKWAERVSDPSPEDLFRWLAAINKMSPHRTTQCHLLDCREWSGGYHDLGDYWA